MKGVLYYQNSISFQLQGGFAPGPRWGLCPQTPVPHHSEEIAATALWGHRPPSPGISISLQLRLPPAGVCAIASLAGW